MTSSKLRLLLNANLSPETARFLREKFLFDVRCILEDRLGRLSDHDITKHAKTDNRIIVTSDLDFRQLYHFASDEQPGIIVLRLADQTIENTNRVLGDFFRGFADRASLVRSLLVIEERRYRVYQTGED